MPAARTPAQIEAARLNGAKSRGPRTEEGKARSAMNALRHGLAAKGHALLAWEDPQAWDDLVAGLVEEHAPEGETGARLVLRLAAALWRQERADRLEVRMYDAAPRPEYYIDGRLEHAHPEETFDLARLNAIRSYRNQASLEASRTLRELRALRREASATAEQENEPDRAPTVANENAASDSPASRNPANEPDRPAKAPPAPAHRPAATTPALVPAPDHPAAALAGAPAPFPRPTRAAAGG